MNLRNALLAAALLLPALASANPFLVQDGEVLAEIIVAEEPARAAEFGAKELQAYLEKITGCRLEIVTSPTDKPNRVFVGDSAAAAAVGATSEGLGRDAFRILSGENWLALVGNDEEFTPIEPWARHHNDWANDKQAKWEALARHPWMNPVGSRLYRDYNKTLDIWNLDHRGSLNAVYAFLRELGVRWYMPGLLGEVLPETDTVAISEIDRTVTPTFEVRTISRPLISSNEIEDALWYLRIGANEQYGILHHGQLNLTEHPEQRASHPDYYVMLADGTRDTQSKTANACLSSPGFFDETVAYARLMFDHYDIPILSVMPHDGFTHCQCDLCRDQIDLDRGPAGQSSDYVWDFVLRVAEELAKTHPDHKVFSGAYSNYRLPPLRIDKFPPNVLIQITNGRPIRDLDDAVHEEAAELRRQWLEKTDNPLSVTLNYTPTTDNGEFRPQYFPHVIARGIRDTRDEVWRDDLWISNGKGGLHFPGMSHLNPYITSVFWWNAEADVDAVLAEYYDQFYGPAAAPMQAFIEFCEAEYANLGADPEITKKALELFDAAADAVPADTVYQERIALVDEFLPTLRGRAVQISVKRPEDRPDYRIIDMGNSKWTEACQTFQLDGRLDEDFWTCYPHARPLRDNATGRKAVGESRMLVRWYQDALYFGIRCDFDPSDPPVIGSEKDDDPAIWQGEHLELHLETDRNSYYQIVVNPAGALIDLDRGMPMRDNKAYSWSSQAEVAAQVADDHWSVEIRLPVTSSDEDPLHQIVGNRPYRARDQDLASGKGSSLLWYFNVFRKRSGSGSVETTAFSPLGPEAQTLHEPIRFADFFIQ